MKTNYKEIERWDVSESDWKLFVTGLLVGVVMGGLAVMTYMLENTI